MRKFFCQRKALRKISLCYVTQHVTVTHKIIAHYVKTFPLCIASHLVGINGVGDQMAINLLDGVQRHLDNYSVHGRIVVEFVQMIEQFNLGGNKKQIDKSRSSSENRFFPTFEK